MGEPTIGQPPEPSAGTIQRVLDAVRRPAPPASDGATVVHPTRSAPFSLAHVIFILVPVLGGLGGTTTFTTKQINGLSAAISATAATVEQMNDTLIEVKVGQQSNSAKVIGFEGEIENLKLELDRLRTRAVSDERLKVESVEREALAKQMAADLKSLEMRLTDLIHAMNVLIDSNVNAIGLHTLQVDNLKRADDRTKEAIDQLKKEPQDGPG